MKRRFLYLTPDTEDDEVTTALQAALGEADWAFERLTLPRGETHRAPSSHLAWVRERASSRDAGDALIIGGFSIGARVALHAAGALFADAVVCVGFPFHPKGEPQNQRGLVELRVTPLRTFIVQGERDSHGDAARVSTMVLPSHVAVHWVSDGNHRLAPRVKNGDNSGLSLVGNAVEAAQAVVRFTQTL